MKALIVPPTVTIKHELFIIDEHREIRISMDHPEKATVSWSLADGVTHKLTVTAEDLLEKLLSLFTNITAVEDTETQITQRQPLFRKE